MSKRSSITAAIGVSLWLVTTKMAWDSATTAGFVLWILASLWLAFVVGLAVGLLDD